MKKIIFVFMVLSILAPLSSMAASGKAIIPHYFSYYAAQADEYRYYIFVSNITESTIDVQIKLYDASGVIIYDGDDSASTGTILANNVSNYDDNPSGASVSFQLSGNNSGYIEVSFSAWKYGYGTIEWQQSSDAVQGLVAYGRMLRVHKPSDSRQWGFGISVPINEGNPF